MRDERECIWVEVWDDPDVTGPEDVLNVGVVVDIAVEQVADRVELH